MLKEMWNVKETQIERKSVFWNMMSSGINSIVSMLLLWVVTAINGVDDAGVFSLGFSTSQMMLTIGNYGMRNYQATDLKNKYSMPVYKASRIVTNAAMMAATVLFVLGSGYYWQKAMVTVMLCILKVTDALDDVYGGEYQRNGRLDIAGKIMSIRIIAYVTAFCIALIISNNLLVACFAASVVSFLVLYVLIYTTRELFAIRRPDFQWKQIGELLKECFPLCISAFLLIYMSNAPKYAIDAYLPASSQAYYTYLFMPCFVTNLFVGFALQPLLVKMSKSWIHKEYRRFLKLCGGILAGSVGIAAVIVAAGSLCGIWALSLVFGVDLHSYQTTLVVLLIGGSFFAFAVIEQVILTVIRRQGFLLLGFVISSVTAFLVSKPLVMKMGLLGAGFAYTVSAGVLFAVLGIIIVFSMIKEIRNSR